MISTVFDENRDSDSKCRLVAGKTTRLDSTNLITSATTDASILTDMMRPMKDTFGQFGNIQVASKVFCGFGDRTRLAILLMVADGEQRVSDIVQALDGSQGNISGHLRCLKDCGLVADRRSGREVYYRISHNEVIHVLRSVEQLLAVTGHRIELCANYEPVTP